MRVGRTLRLVRSGGGQPARFARSVRLERGVINLRLAPAQQSSFASSGRRSVDLAASRYRVDAIEGAPLG
jgi:hypothetical protein